MASSIDPTHPKAVQDTGEDVIGHRYRSSTLPDNEVTSDEGLAAGEPREQTPDGSDDVLGHGIRRPAAPDDDGEGHAGRVTF